MEKDLADTIIWWAKERMKTEKFQNLNSAIHAVNLDISQYLMEIMADNKQ